MIVKYGEGRTEYGPGVSVELTGDEVATAIDVVWRRPQGRGSPVKLSFLTLSLIALWVAWVAGLLGVLWLGIWACTGSSPTGSTSAIG